MAWFWTALSVIAFLYALQRVLSLPKRKKMPPSPIGLPIIGHLHLLGKKPHRNLRDLARKHGPLMHLRFGFVDMIVATSPAAAELLLKTHDLNFSSRPRHETSKYVSYEQRNLVFGTYGPYWRNMRKLSTLELLSNLRINQFRDMREREVGLMVDELRQAAQERRVVDVSTRVLALNKDMNSLIVFGNKYSEGSMNEKGFKAVMVETLEVSSKFNMADYWPYIGKLDLQGLNRRMKALAKVFDGILERIIDEHVQNRDKKKQTKDFVDTMMEIMDSGEAGFEFDRRHVKAVLLDLFLAGTDTSATTVEWALSELIRHPHIMKKLQKELESVVGMDRMVDESHLDKLQYLDLVVKETLRLHPVVPLLVPHMAIEDCVVDGFYVPKGTQAIVNVWAIGRDPNVWPDPETFSPERFMNSNIDLKGQHFQLLPFGSGRRGCPGTQLGLIEVKSVLAQLVHCFDLELPDGKKPTDLDMEEHFGVVIARDNHLMAIPHFRLSL